MVGVEKKQLETFKLNAEVSAKVEELARKRISEKLEKVVEFASKENKDELLSLGEKRFCI